VKSLVLLAILLFATKQLGESVLSFCCLLLLGYGIYVVIRDRPTSGFLRGVTTSRPA
jgi:hypothetical protein